MIVGMLFNLKAILSLYIQVGIYYFTKDCELVKFADVIDSKSVDDANDDQVLLAFL